MDYNIFIKFCFAARKSEHNLNGYTYTGTQKKCRFRKNRPLKSYAISASKTISVVKNTTCIRFFSLKIDQY